MHSKELVHVGYYHRCYILLIYILFAFLQSKNQQTHYVFLQAALPSPKSIEAVGLCIDHISRRSLPEGCKVLTLIHSAAIHGSLLPHQPPPLKHKNTIKKQQGWKLQPLLGQDLGNFHPEGWGWFLTLTAALEIQAVGLKQTYPVIQLGSSCLGAVQRTWQAGVLVEAGNLFSLRGGTGEPAAKHRSKNPSIHPRYT